MDWVDVANLAITSYVCAPDWNDRNDRRKTMKGTNHLILSEDAVTEIFDDYFHRMFPKLGRVVSVRFDGGMATVALEEPGNTPATFPKGEIEEILRPAVLNDVEPGRRLTVTRREMRE